MSDERPFPRPVELPDPEDEAPSADPGAPAEPGEPGIADGRDRPIDRNWITVRRLTGLLRQGIFWGVAFVGLVLVALFADLRSGVAPWAFGLWFVLAALGIFRAIWWPKLAYRYISYRVTDRLFRFRHGVLWRSVVSVPKSRVQHTDVSQGPLERNFGIARLIVHTAGTDNASVSLGGLPYDTAMKIRDHLIDSDEDDAV